MIAIFSMLSFDAFIGYLIVVGILGIIFFVSIYLQDRKKKKS